MIAYCIFSVTLLYLAVSLTAAGQICSGTGLANFCCKVTESCCDSGCCVYQSATCCPNKKCCASDYPVCCTDHCCPTTHGKCCGTGCCSNSYPVCCGSYCCPSGTYCCGNQQCCYIGRRRSIKELNSHPLLEVTINYIQSLNTTVADTMVASKEDNEQAAVENEVKWSAGAEKKKEFEDRHKITTRSAVIVDLGECFNYERLKLNEGYETCRYFDTKGIPTIGVGFNLQKNGARDKITAVGADYDKILAGTECLNDEQIRQLLQHDADDAANCAKDFTSKWNQLHSGAKSAIADMAFNLGCAGLNKFECLQDALFRPDYQWAAEEMKDSLWCRQVGNRCQRDIDCMLA